MADKVRKLGGKIRLFKRKSSIRNIVLKLYTYAIMLKIDKSIVWLKMRLREQ